MFGLSGEQGDPPGADRKVRVALEACHAGDEDFDGLARVVVFKRGVCGLGVIGGQMCFHRVLGDQLDPARVRFGV